MLKALVALACIAIIGSVGWTAYSAYSGSVAAGQVASAEATCAAFVDVLDADNEQRTLAADDRRTLQAVVANCEKD